MGTDQIEDYLRGALERDSSPGPVYRRIAASIAAGIAAGRLHPGDQLPTHRALATRLGVAVPTISRAYREAEQRGLVNSTVGRGTFVSGIPTLRHTPAADVPNQPLDLSVNGPARGPHEALLREAFLGAATGPDLTPFLDYAADVGNAGHRAAAASWLSQAGLDPDPDRVVICQGGQHAILVALGTLLRPGDVLLAEAMTYPGLKSAAELLGVSVIGVDMDPDGIVPASLELACAATAGRQRALYLMPTAHNPTAITMPRERRDSVVALARQHDLHIIEDDVFGLLAPADTTTPPIVSLAPERTLYLTSLSKALTPGLRWGAIVGPDRLVDRMGALVRATIFNPAPLALDLARRWILDGTAARLLDWQRTEMAARFALAHRCLDGSAGVAAVRTAGLHAWVELNDPWTSTEAVALAERLGILLVSSGFFNADGGSGIDAQTWGMRVCLGNAPDRDTLTAALHRLGDALDHRPTWSAGTRV